jgi:hypothetical protein
MMFEQKFVPLYISGKAKNVKFKVIEEELKLVLTI